MEEVSALVDVIPDIILISVIMTLAVKRYVEMERCLCCLVMMVMKIMEMDALLPAH
jgi:hypothetical protein